MVESNRLESIIRALNQAATLANRPDGGERGGSR